MLKARRRSRRNEDNEIARRSIVERLFKNVSWDTLDDDARANLYYYACDYGLLAETLEKQERQGTASSQDAPLHGLQPGRMSHGSSDEDDAKRRATPHRKAYKKAYNAEYRKRRPLEAT